MRQEPNNEIDLLLRRLGRQPGTSVSDGGHLDADELSSYAENALPPSARARYTEHLAECSSCRTLVVQLSSAAGVVVAAERSVVPASSGFGKFLASLFSPLVLRYAIPALGLAVIAVIGLTVFRADQPSDTDIAQRSSAPEPVNEQVNAPATGAASDSNLKDQKSAASAMTETDRINQSKESTPAPTAVDRISAPAGDVSGASAEASPPKPEARPGVGNTPASSPASAATEVNERKVEVPVQKQEVERQVDAARQPQRAYSTESRDESRRAGNEAPAPAAAPASKTRVDDGTVRTQTGSGATLQSVTPEKDSDDAEVRTVVGRRFRKRGNVWVDTAYNSSSEAMNLARGSERYRALVADEPAIKNIADQLDGEIIVVWKGRAYRIR